MTGNRMFPFVTATWNPLAGKCLHACSYCWSTRLQKLYPRLRDKYDGEPRIVKSELKKLSKFKADDVVFACDMTDLFGSWVDSQFISFLLEQIRHSPAEFLLLTKNPQRYTEFLTIMPDNVTLGATIESDIDHLANAEPVVTRLENITLLKEQGYRTMVSVEPVLKFSADFPRRLGCLWADYYAVGFDNYNSGLPEPTSEEVLALIKYLEDNGHKVYRKTLR